MHRQTNRGDKGAEEGWEEYRKGAGRVEGAGRGQPMVLARGGGFLIFAQTYFHSIFELS